MAGPRGVKLDETTQQRLEALAQLKERSPHWLMCTAIKTYLDREEAYEREKREDLERWERYQLTGDAVPQATAAAWLGELAQGRALPCPK